MEDAADAVVPLRPGFDVTFRGFHRDQVLEHLEVLENQLELVTIDRNEAARLNSDLRALYDRTREELNATQQRLRHLETSDTGLPVASQRVQEMLNMAEEELQTLREQARHEAEIIRGAAETEADRLIEQAEGTAGELHEQCEQVLAEIERRRDQLNRERTHQLKELREREQRMRRSIRDAYKSLMSAAEQQAEELDERTRQECARRETETEDYRQRVLEEIEHNRSELETLRTQVLTALDTATDRIGSSVTSLQRSTVENVGSDERPASRSIPEQSSKEPPAGTPVEGEVPDGQMWLPVQWGDPTNAEVTYFESPESVYRDPSGPPGDENSREFTADATAQSLRQDEESDSGRELRGTDTTGPAARN
ncbi:cell division septum initiation protein DivIVA [Actinopolyspora biskrensis]|uniref:Cell division septum initiation protein DivIVA n=1 Tax=Actinopolyspora biskrensis TaxID=1470178 RepID=A0A852YYG7_9ACTN|nr:hypothetical protein [Actinopolyspora biskrensis]NYH79641.1 cell division septum initiation protein DivIVA [Actinopolyspora biskrensis]